jgi:hypothetical protein
MRLQERGEQLAKRMFTGGPVASFETAGRLQLITMLREGLYPASKVVDIGCGCLRGGYWLIHFLDAGGYFGIEPNTQMLEAGSHEILEKEALEGKRPRFDSNSDFDVSVFGEKFDFFLARSIWTHASREQIATMLDNFLRFSPDTGTFLTSYLRAGWFRNRAYTGSGWVGRSHASKEPGTIYHDLAWIQAECSRRGLVARELDEDVLNKQIWLKITRK